MHHPFTFLSSARFGISDLDGFTGSLMQFAFQGLVIVAIAFALIRLVARDDARSRRRVLLTAFVGLLLLPALSGVVPDSFTVSLTNPLLPATTSDPSTEAKLRTLGSESEFLSVLRTDSPVHRSGMTAETLVSEPPVSESSRSDFSTTQELRGSFNLLPQRYSEAPTVGAQPTLSSRLSSLVLPAVFTIWLLGSVLLSLRWIFAGLKLRGLIRHSVALDQMAAPTTGTKRWSAKQRNEAGPGASKRANRAWRQSWQSVLDRASADLELDRTVELRFTRPSADRAIPLRESSPCTFGFAKPRILLPAAAIHWDDARRRVVLLHELGHIKSHDWLARRFAQLGCAVHWFNPLVWLAFDRLKLEQENSCDRIVLEAGVRPSDYARHLLELVSSMRHMAPSSTLAMIDRSKNTPSRLEARLMNILDSSTDPSRRRRLLSLSIPAFLLSILLVPLVAAIELQPKQEKAPRAVLVPSVDEFTSDDYAIETPPAPDAVNPAIVAPEIAGGTVRVPRVRSRIAPTAPVRPAFATAPSPAVAPRVAPVVVPMAELVESLAEFAIPPGEIAPIVDSLASLQAFVPAAPMAPAALSYRIARGETRQLDDGEAAELYERLEALSDRHDDLAEQLHEQLSSIFDGEMHESFRESIHQIQQRMHERLEHFHAEEQHVDQQAMEEIQRRIQDKVAVHAEQIAAHAQRLAEIRGSADPQLDEERRAEREALRQEMDVAREELQKNVAVEREELQREMEVMRGEMEARRSEMAQRSEQMRAKIEPLREEIEREAAKMRERARELREQSEETTRQFRSEMRDIEREIERTHRELRDLERSRRDAERRELRHQGRDVERDGDADGRRDQRPLRD